MTPGDAVGLLILGFILGGMLLVNVAIQVEQNNKRRQKTTKTTKVLKDAAYWQNRANILWEANRHIWEQMTPLQFDIDLGMWANQEIRVILAKRHKANITKPEPRYFYTNPNSRLGSAIERPVKTTHNYKFKICKDTDVD